MRHSSFPRLAALWATALITIAAIVAFASSPSAFSSTTPQPQGGSVVAAPRLTIGAVMTGQELEETGVVGLSPSQRKALDDWLNRYTERILSVRSSPTGTRSDCSPAIEDEISGEFHGWDGETIFKLSNGQIWQQAEYDYDYEYDYEPSITIYQANGGCRMKVEDVEETILVRRLK